MFSTSKVRSIADQRKSEGRTPVPGKDPFAQGPRRFLAMPADEVAFLRSTLSLYLGQPRVEELLRLFGRRLGRSMATLDPEAPDVAEMICQLGAQVGLGKLSHVAGTAPAPNLEGADAGDAEGSRPTADERGWVLLLERLAEQVPAGGTKGAPVFTAGLVEGLFEGVLGVRVRGELRSRGEGRWELSIGLLPSAGPEARGTTRFHLPTTRAYRLEVPAGGPFFDRLAPYVVPGSTLGFTREPPRRLRAEFGFAGVELHWFAVTNRPGESVVSPRQIGHAVEVLETYLRAHQGPVLVFLQGLDYLENRNAYSTIVRLVEVVKERVTAAGGVLVVELPVETLDPDTVLQLRREVVDVLPSDAA